ncbi:hypothetical protein [Undibacterium sp. Dicai25W]|uniref:hypothetical protein n=1 Tax=Undibacterium sp. Dicai25W TaxID=3413034 RepID=UPI003BF50CA8
MNVHPPKGWDEFEDIVCSMAKVQWKGTSFQRHGRQGQAQNGVDVYGYDAEDKIIGLQCKNTIEGISESIIADEIQNAESFQPPLSKLIIATTAKTDKELQKYVRMISEQRKIAGKFSVEIYFWSGIWQILTADDNALFQHYPQLKPKSHQVNWPNWYTIGISILLIFVVAALLIWISEKTKKSSLLIGMPSYVLASDGSIEYALSISNKGNLDQTISDIEPILTSDNGHSIRLSSNLNGTHGSIDEIRVKKGEVLIKKVRVKLPSSAKYDLNNPCVIPKANPQIFELAFQFVVIDSEGERNISKFLISKGSVDVRQITVSFFLDPFDVATNQTTQLFSKKEDANRRVTESGVLPLDQPRMISGNSKDWITGLNPIEAINFMIAPAIFDESKCIQFGNENNIFGKSNSK